MVVMVFMVIMAVAVLIVVRVLLVVDVHRDILIWMAKQIVKAILRLLVLKPTSSLKGVPLTKRTSTRGSRLKTMWSVDEYNKRRGINNCI
jgi:hypothetical protein